MKLYTSGGSIYEEDENDTSSPAGVKADGNMLISGGQILCVSTGDGGKGLNVDGNLTMEDGSVNVVTSGGKYVYNASLDLDSSPKGIKADGQITINGGSINIRVKGRTDGSEGLESKSKITINAGDVYVYAYDDAINVGGDNPTGIEFNGGRTFAFAENNQWKTSCQRRTSHSIRQRNTGRRAGLRPQPEFHSQGRNTGRHRGSCHINLKFKQPEGGDIQRSKRQDQRSFPTLRAKRY